LAFKLACDFVPGLQVVERPAGRPEETMADPEIVRALVDGMLSWRHRKFDDAACIRMMDAQYEFLVGQWQAGLSPKKPSRRDADIAAMRMIQSWGKLRFDRDACEELAKTLDPSLKSLARRTALKQRTKTLQNLVRRDDP
jgi:hypothetical protein